jgi:hypothetical protein
MRLDDVNLEKQWIYLPSRHRRYRFSYKETNANGLCFYYSLRIHGIFDPREKIIQFLLNDQNEMFILWWMENTRAYRNSSVQDVIRVLRAPLIENNPIDVWVDSDFLLLISLVFKMKIFVLQQDTEAINCIHELLQESSKCFGIEVNFEIIISAFFYLHCYSAPDDLGSSCILNHYVPLRLEFPEGEDFSNNLDEWVLVYNQFIQRPRAKQARYRWILR